MTESFFQGLKLKYEVHERTSGKVSASSKSWRYCEI